MKMNEGVEWAAHCAVILASTPEGYATPMSVLAEFHGLRPSYLAKTLQALARADIVVASTGKLGGYRLARPAPEITLLDIVMAVDGQQRAFRCTEVRQNGPSAVKRSLYSRSCGIAETMWRAEDAWREALARTTVADLVAMTLRDSPADALEKGITWLGNEIGRRR
ncbi:MAG: RrF2 family transcriptional regulator [Acidimicrobiales bacterium]